MDAEEGEDVVEEGGEGEKKEGGEEARPMHDKTQTTDPEDPTAPRPPSSTKVSLISRVPMLVSRRRTWRRSSSGS